MQLIPTLTSLVPDADWVIEGEYEYDNLIWLDVDIPKPSEQECLDHWESIKTAIVTEQIRQQREAAYRQYADPLFLQVWRGEAEEQEWLDAVQLVRDTYPYPED